MIKKYNLNDLQLSNFERFIKTNFTNQLLQYIGGVVGIGKTQIIKAIKERFLKTNDEHKFYNIHYKCCFIDRWNNCPFFIWFIN